MMFMMMNMRIVMKRIMSEGLNVYLLLTKVCKYRVLSAI